MTPRQQEVLDALRQHGPITPTKLAVKMGIPRAAYSGSSRMSPYLLQLVAEGYAARTGNGVYVAQFDADLPVAPDKSTTDVHIIGVDRATGPDETATQHGPGPWFGPLPNGSLEEKLNALDPRGGQREGIAHESMGAAEMLGLDRYEAVGTHGHLMDIDIKTVEPLDRLAGIVVESKHKVFYSNDLSGGYLGATVVAVVAVAASENQARADIAVAMAAAGFPQDRAFTVVELDTTKPGVVILDDGDY